MTNSEREQLTANIREIIAGRDDGIELETEFCWVVSGVIQPVAFFQSLFLLLPPDATLYFEGCTIARDVAAFYEAHEARQVVAVVRDTIFPVSECFHVEVSPEFVTRLGEFAASRPSNELFDHVKAYHGESLLLHFHDAFQRSVSEDDFMISTQVAESAVAEFSRRLGGNYQHKPFINQRIQGLRGLLTAMENPGNIRIAGEPWWRRWWRRWTWR
jgi:hypothetical protein